MNKIYVSLYSYREGGACQLTPLCSEGYVCDPQCDWVTHWAIAEDINVNQTV